MKKLICLLITALIAAGAVSCKKDSAGSKEEEKINPIPEDAVDLGIVMTRTDGTSYKLYWAMCNLGATKPEEYGGYYAWGETETKSSYSWSNYSYGTSANGPFSEYNTKSDYGLVDNKKVLDTGENGDDAVSKARGGKWRMPTDAEWTALLEQCGWSWTNDFNGTGVAGRVVASSVTGRSIFLPAAGSWGSSLGADGISADYWSSSLDVDRPYQAYHIQFDSNSFKRNHNNRYFGFSIRPVYEE